MMEDVFLRIVVVGMLFIGLPWLIFHYVTKWKTSSSLTREDEDLLDSLHDTARRLEERLITIERIVAADHPDFKPDYKPHHGPASVDPAGYHRSN